jgi:hypothetical protein
MAEADQAVFTVKEWLQRIDSKQDALDEKIDRVTESLDRKADARDVRELADRVTIIEQQAAARVNMVDRLEAHVDINSDKIDQKADKGELVGLQRLFISTLGGAAVAILAWALTLFVR